MMVMDVERALEAIRLSNRGRLGADVLDSLRRATYGLSGDAAARALHAALRRFEDLDDTLGDLHALVDELLANETHGVSGSKNVQLLIDKTTGKLREYIRKPVALKYIALPSARTLLDRYLREDRIRHKG